MDEVEQWLKFCRTLATIEDGVCGRRRIEHWRLRKRILMLAEST